MGFISEEEADKRINSDSNLLNRLGKLNKQIPAKTTDELDASLEDVQQNPTDPSADDAVRLAILAGRRHLRPSSERGGRYVQQGNVPPIFRALIGSAAKLGTAAEAARQWGVNPTMAHHYKHGRTGQERESLGLADRIDLNTLHVRAQVLDILTCTLTGITPESLENKDAKDLSMIAKNLASIMGTTRPAVVNEQTNTAQVIVFSPDQEKENTYDTIEVG